MIKSFMGIQPKISSSAYIADTAVIIGNVTIGDNVGIFENAVLRGDEGAIVIGNNSNVQDNCTLHCDENTSINIGEGVTIGHNAIIHGCTIGNDCLIGMGAIVLNNAVIGDGSIVGAGSVVLQNKKFDNNSLLVGSPAVLKRQTSDEDVAATRANAQVYVKLSKNYK